MSGWRVLITGGSGFIGTNLVEHFSAQGCTVLNLDIAPPRNRQQAHLWRAVDLLDRQNLIRAVTEFSPHYLLHFAARTDLKETRNLAGYAANIEGVCNLIDAIRAASSLRRVIFASSQLVCRLGYTPRHELDYAPTTLYGISKMLGERIVRAADELGATWCLVRPTSLWGPWFDVPYKNFFSAIRRGIYVHPNGVNTLKQWGFVKNSVYQVERLLYASAESIHKKVFYLADYQPLELRHFANMVQEAFDAHPIRSVPPALLRLAARMGDLLQGIGWRNPPLTSFRYHNIITSELCDLTPLQAIVGDLPYNTAQGVQMTVAWMKSHDTPQPFALPERNVL